MLIFLQTCFTDPFINQQMRRPLPSRVLVFSLFSGSRPTETWITKKHPWVELNSAVESLLFWMKNNPQLSFLEFDQWNFFNHTYTDRSVSCIVNEKKKKEVLLGFHQRIYTFLFDHIARRTKTSVGSIAVSIVYLSKILTGMAPAHATVIRVKRRNKRRKHREPNRVILLKKRYRTPDRFCLRRILGGS